MGALKRIRPSNFVILATAPFFIYLFASSEDYQRSLAEVLGVEADGWPQFTAFLWCLLTLGAGCVLPYLHVRRRPLTVGWIAAGVSLAGGAYLATRADVGAFVNAIVANSVDPYDSELIVKAKTPRELTPGALVMSIGYLRQAAAIYLLASAALLALVAAGTLRSIRLATRIGVSGLAILNGVALAYLLLIAHLGFATGLFITLRAAILAYLAAALLGLSLAGLQMLQPKRRTFALHAGMSALLLAGAAYFFLQPTETSVLVGTLDKQMGIVSGMPQGIVETARHSEYDGGDAKTIKTRSIATVDEALSELKSGERISSALIPADRAPAGMPVLWEVTYLPDRHRTPALALGIVGLLMGILTFGGLMHGRHPFAIASEFFVDTVRGIPMLVIILYVGFPLSGAVKDMSGGGIDMSNLTRGIIALSIGYAAYMAEIFRAGINSVPRGQVEAARSLGLKNWHVARFIVLPQALRVIIPPLGNELIAILKDTSLLSALSVRDLTQRMREFQSAYFLVFPPYNTLAIFYVFLTLAVASLLKWIERRYHVASH